MACGMPGWLPLVRRLTDHAAASVAEAADDLLISEIRNAIDQNQLLLAVSLLRNILTPVELSRVISQQYDMAAFHRAPGATQTRMLQRLDNLLNGQWAGIITTNYDNLIEHGMGQFTRGDYLQCRVTDDGFGAILSSYSAMTRFFVKLHGSVSGGGYVLGTEEYDRTYLSSSRVIFFLVALMLRYHIIFIGCSLEDEILRLRRRLCLDFDGNIPPAYALLPRNGANLARRQWLVNQARIIPLLYELNTDGDGATHGGVDEFLSATREDVDATGRAETRSMTMGIPETLRALPEPKRLQEIGLLNRDLLSFIARAGGTTGLAHADLLQPHKATIRCPNSVLSLRKRRTMPA